MHEKFRGPLLENFSEFQWSLRSSGQTAWATLCSESVSSLCALPVRLHWPVCINCPTYCSFLATGAAAARPAVQPPAGAYLQTLFICGSPGGWYWSLPALALAGSEKWSSQGGVETESGTMATSLFTFILNKNVSTKCRSGLQLKSYLDQQSTGKQLQERMFPSLHTFEVTLCSNISFSYCSFNWLFDLHCAEWFMSRIYTWEIVFICIH